MRGVRVAESVKGPTLDLGSGHDLTVQEFKPHVRVRAGGAEPAWDSGQGPLPFLRRLGSHVLSALRQDPQVPAPSLWLPCCPSPHPKVHFPLKYPHSDQENDPMTAYKWIWDRPCCNISKYFQCFWTYFSVTCFMAIPSLEFVLPLYNERVNSLSSLSFRTV